MDNLSKGSVGRSSCPWGLQGLASPAFLTSHKSLSPCGAPGLGKRPEMLDLSWDTGTGRADVGRSSQGVCEQLNNGICWEAPSEGAGC